MESSIRTGNPNHLSELFCDHGRKYGEGNLGRMPDWVANLRIVTGIVGWAGKACVVGRAWVETHYVAVRLCHAVRAFLFK